MLSVRAYFKRSSDKEHLLPKKLPNDSPTRPWCGLSQFFTAFYKSYDEIKNLLPEKIDMPSNKDLIKQIGDGLSQFTSVFKSLECASYPTLHLVVKRFSDMHKFIEKWDLIVISLSVGKLLYVQKVLRELTITSLSV